MDKNVNVGENKIKGKSRGGGKLGYEDLDDCGGRSNGGEKEDGGDDVDRYALPGEKLKESLREHKDDLIRCFAEEWDDMERIAKREELIRKAGDASLVAGKYLLKLLAVGGVCTTALVAPNVFVVYGEVKKRKGFFHQKGTQKNLYYLKRQGYVKYTRQKKDEYLIEITERGMNEVLREGFKKLHIRKGQRWDGKWRIVMFDIPERYKWGREGFRRRLEEIGCRQLQKSVFVTPYRCKKEVVLISEIYGVKEFVKIIRTKDTPVEGDIGVYFFNAQDST